MEKLESSHAPFNRYQQPAITHNAFLVKFHCQISSQISLKFVPKSQIDKNSALVQVMAWRQTGDKPLPEPILSQFTDTYMRH